VSVPRKKPSRPRSASQALTWDNPPVPTEAALEASRLFCIRQLHIAESMCSQRHFTLEMAGQNPERLRARSVVRILRATLAAILQGDDESLAKLDAVALRALERARGAQHQATGTLMITLPHGTYPDHDISFSVADIVPEKKRPDGRPLHLVILRNTLAMWIGKWNLSTVDLARQFLLFSQGFGTLAILRDEGVDPFKSDALQMLHDAFVHLISRFDPKVSEEDRAERLLIAGMKALGMSKDKAESLFDFEKKATKRRGTAT
jgi:hypothetical protein